MRHVLPTALAVLFASASANAQIASTVGPPVAPLGCAISITISNDTPVPIWTGVCPYRVEDARGRIIYTPICIAIAQQISAGGTFSTTWPQVDNDGQPVAAGDYVVVVQLPGVTVSSRHPIKISATARAGVANMGVVRPGTTRNLYLCSPSTPDDLYLMAASASGTAPGLLTCGGRWALNLDPLFFVSLQPNPVFLDFIGFLDGMGTATDPAIALPPISDLTGLSFHVAFLALNTGAGCPVSATSEPLLVSVR